MRNYIILNGTNSNTITGLLIQSLAPISKPLMRTEIEEIDGRDGDIITPLGFSAYDKQITIGLYGTYDINAIIAFFNSEGTVTFSNEPDKYYNYQIYDQIDFERLVRFKTATVTLHCQPFKFATTGETVSFGDGSTVSGEGTNLVLEGSQLAPFNHFDLKGNTAQDGTPTPSAPVPVQVVTGENTVKIRGKNLASPAATAGTDRGITFSLAETSGGTKINGRTTTTYAISPVAAATLAAGTYTLSIDKTLTFGFGLATYSSGTRVTHYIAAGSKSLTFTLSSAADGYDIYIAGVSANTDINETLKVQLEKSNQATDWDSYQEQSYEVNLGNIELCKIGTYQDYIWKDGDTWKVHKATGKQTLASGDITLVDSYSNVRYAAFPKTSDNIQNGNYDYGDIVNFFSAARNMGGMPSGGWNTYTADGEVYNNATRTAWWCSFTKATTLATMQEKLTGMVVYYVLATPTDTAITNTALIEQLDAIANQAHAYKTRTYIDSNAATGNVPHIIAAEVVTASADGTVTNAGNIYSKPRLTIYGSGNIGVYLNGVQMLQVALGSLGSITIDTNLMEAYTGTPDNLQNRAVTGDYSNFKLAVGANKISFSGSVTSCIVENFSRWL